MILGCVVWSLWFERNRLKFHNGVRDYDKLVYTIKLRVLTWAKELLGLHVKDTPGHHEPCCCSLYLSFDLVCIDV
jgi:hypothetical protein